MDQPVLQVQGVSARYGALEVVHDVSFDVHQGQLTCLIGANGAGKSTTLRVLAGQHRTARGTILLDGEPIQRLSAHRVSRKRLALVPEGRRVFAGLTTRQNLQMGAYAVPGAWKSTDQLDEVFSLFPELVPVSDRMAGLLSGGQQQMLAIGRALMSRPRVLILDEPSMGLAPILVDRIFEALMEQKRRGTTILLAEQNARLALRLADHACVLELGRVVESGPADDLRGSTRIEEIYFGGHAVTPVTDDSDERSAVASDGE